MIALTDLWGNTVPWWGAVAGLLGGALGWAAGGWAYGKIVRRRR